MLAGNLVAILMSGIIHFVWSMWIDPADYDFAELDAHILLVENDKRGLTEGTFVAPCHWKVVQKSFGSFQLPNTVVPVSDNLLSSQCSGTRPEGAASCRKVDHQTRLGSHPSACHYLAGPVPACWYFQSGLLRILGLARDRLGLWSRHHHHGLTYHGKQ